MISKNSQRQSSKSIYVMLAVLAVGVVTAVSFESSAIAQQQSSGSKMGTIASIQNEKGKPAWVLAGVWDMKNVNSSSPTFNATFNMVMLDGSAPHKHNITDFKITGSPAKQGKATTINGTATITLKSGPATNVPISIKLMGPQAMSLWIDPSKTGNHFGDTPIYGIQHRVG